MTLSIKYIPLDQSSPAETHSTTRIFEWLPMPARCHQHPKVDHAFSVTFSPNHSCYVAEVHWIQWIMEFLDSTKESALCTDQLWIYCCSERIHCIVDQNAINQTAGATECKTNNSTKKANKVRWDKLRLLRSLTRYQIFVRHFFSNPANSRNTLLFLLN